jgi:short-subunit dehydrogenase
MQQKTILLTGGSAGIGLATAKLLSGQGHVVYSISRRKSEDSVAEKGKIISLTGDVNDEGMIKKEVERMIAAGVAIDAVICNAGNGIAGAIEDTSITEARYQFETNFFGVVKTIQACLPVFRTQGHGKIIVLSSVAAAAPLPYQGYYSAVKSALLVLVQALSVELKPYNIQCCVVLPGDTKTEFTKNRRYAEAALTASSPYAERMRRSVGKMEKDETNGMPAEAIATCIAKQINKKNCNLIVVPGFQYKISYWLLNRMPAWLRMRIIGSMY